MSGCRMGRMVRWAAGAALLACAARAADTIEDGVLALDASDAGRTLQAALAARNLALADLASVTSLVVDCTGVVTSDVALADWSGDLRIRPQSVFEVTADGALGTADGAIFIEDGGQLKMSVKTASTWTQVKKTCSFEGEGPDGSGALCSVSAEHQNGNCLWPYRLVMTGDATWKMGNRSQMDVLGAELDMNGHTLRYGVRGRFHGVKITNPGHIIALDLANPMLIQGDCSFGGGATNTITFKSGAVMNFWGNPGTTPWTAILEPGARLYPGSGSDDNWQGPVVLGGTVPMYRWNPWPTMTFYGPVSGPGGFSSQGGDRADTITLRLACPTNAFQGGVRLRESVLDLPVDGGLPADGAALMMTNSSVTLAEGPVYDLPAAVFSGTGTVSRGSGAWRGSVTKEAAGELVYASSVGADVLDVKGGSVRLEPRSCGGLHQGIEVGTAQNDTALALFKSTDCPKTGTATFPDYSYPAKNSAWKSYMCVVYTGYLWNRTDAEAVWTFGACIDDKARLVINGETVLDCTAWSDLKFGQATLKPGANTFEWRMYNAAGGAGGSNGGGAVNWTAAKGLAYHVGATDSKDPADFTAFTADDAGTLFTFVDDAATMPAPAFGTVRLAAGTTLDLGGFAYAAKTVEGVGTVAGGALTVEEALVVPAAAARAGGALAVEGTLAFGAEAVLDVDEPEALAHAGELVVATAGEVVGKPALSPALKAANWSVSCADGKVTLRRSGFAIIFR